MASLRMLSALLLGAVLLALPATAGAIVGGQLDTTHNYVVFVGQRVIYQTPTGEIRNVGGSTCTGALVAPTVVVTAAHCSFVPPPPASIPAGSTVVAVGYVVRQGADVMSPGFNQVPGTFHIQPGFSFGGDGLPHFANNDLAVVKLAAPLPGPYAQLPGLDSASALRPTGALDIVGYGVNEMHGDEPVLPSGFDFKRRRDAARLLGGNAVADDLLHFNGGACLGDSGGPLLAGNVVLGVVSFTPSACKSTNYATRVDSADSLAFIRSFL